MTDRINEDSDAGIDYTAVENSEGFQTLKKTQRSFIFPLAAIFLIWYFVYVLLGAYATDFMGQRVWGDITVGLLLGLGQFVTTFVITMAYVSFANKKLDPKAKHIREELEKAEAHQ
ncbi:DUF485 domain-containing protein [Microbacterium sp. GXF6406]